MLTSLSDHLWRECRAFAGLYNIVTGQHFRPVPVFSAQFGLIPERKAERRGSAYNAAVNKAIGFIMLAVLGCFFGIQVIGAAIVFWPVALILVWWRVNK